MSICLKVESNAYLSFNKGISIDFDLKFKGNFGILVRYKSIKGAKFKVDILVE